jgi:hypothetical protein
LFKADKIEITSSKKTPMNKITTLFAMILLPLHNAIAQIEGTVDDRKGKGLPGVTINAIDTLGKAISTVRSDARGYFSFCGLLPGKYKIQVMAGSFRTVVFRNIEVNEEDKCPPEDTEDYFIRNRLRVVLSTDMTHYQVEGQVIDENEKAQPNISLSITDTSGKVISTAKSDNLGFFGFKNLQPGRYVVKANVVSFRPAIYYVRVTETQKEAEGEDDMIDPTWLYVVLRPATQTK